MMNKAQTMDALKIMMKRFPEAKTSLVANSKFHFLLAVILSAQATDRSVNLATPALFRLFPRPSDLARAKQAEVQDLIKNIGLYKNKAKYLIACSKKLVTDFDSQIPDTLKGLQSLPGVGRKTADVVLAECFGIPTIAVDTHVARVTKRLQMVPQKATPIEIERLLMRKLPQGIWIKAHHTIIFWGRYQCLARSPKCQTCPLINVCAKGQQLMKSKK